MLLAIDQGTTGSTCLVFDEALEPRGRAQAELTQHFPRPGWVEHDLGELLEVTLEVARLALADAGIGAGDLAAVGLTNQRETVCAWEADTGEPLHRALVWQDRRTAPCCDELRARGVEDLVRARTGLVLDPYFSATKLEWLLREVPGLRARAEEGRALLGTVDAFLAHRLCGEHVTDPSNASRTMLYDLARGEWDPELLELFGVPPAALPALGPSAGALGELRDGVLPRGQGVPLAGIAGDQQAALFGQACLEPGLGKSTYGTGSFVLLNTGEAPPPVAPGLVSTVAWALGDAPRAYALEASMFTTGAAVQWLRDGLGIIAEARETEALAASLDSNDGVAFVPALAGLGSPHWDPYARGTILGLTRGTGRAHLARATLEAIAHQSVDAIRAMEEASGEALAELRADGGATANGWLMQFQADVLGVPVDVSELAETTARGAAALAGVGIGLLGLDVVAASRRVGRRYEPAMGEDERGELRAAWARAVERARSWAGP